MDHYLETVPSPTLKGKLTGLLAPHAGIQYSGPVAAHAYALLQNADYDTVVVIGPMHHPIPGVVLTTGHDAYQTPLGTIPVDREILDRLRRSVRLDDLRNDPEHSVEIELPFLQRTLRPGFRLVPLMMFDQSAVTSQALGLALAEALRDRHALIVASSDLSHFYPQQVANRLDWTMLDCVCAMDADRVLECNESAKGFACGHGAIAATLHALQQAEHAEITGYATSGDVTGDFSRVVGYGAAAFWQPQ